LTSIPVLLRSLSVIIQVSKGHTLAKEHPLGTCLSAVKCTGQFDSNHTYYSSNTRSNSRWPILKPDWGLGVVIASHNYQCARYYLLAKPAIMKFKVYNIILQICTG
jgi:hypothetical protein